MSSPQPGFERAGRASHAEEPDVLEGQQERTVNVLRRDLVPWRNSLRLRILALVWVVILGTLLLMAFYTLRQFEKASVFQLEHEALMLSDVLEASIAPSLAGTPDVEALQRHVDRIAVTREKNDIEINILLLQGDRSAIVASNIPDNIEATSDYEHRDLLAALEQGHPIVFIDREEESAPDASPAPGSPDCYIRPGQRFISMTTPLMLEGRKLGSINTKLSLAYVDRQLNTIRSGLLLMGALVPAGALVLVLGAIQRGLRPLNRLGVEVTRIESSHLSHRFSLAGVPFELQPIIARLNELLERLEAAFQRERSFTANVAHELRTPIATLKTLAEVGLQEAAQGLRDAPSRRFYQDTLATARQMEHLVESLLGLVRCEAGQQEVTIRPVELTSLIERAWEAFQAEARERQMDCQFSLIEKASVETDSTLLEAIVRNVLANAVAYTKTKGSIRCTLEHETRGFVLSLTNTCTALAEKDLNNLFEPFWRKDEARADSSHCGLGLSLVSAYAKLLDIAIRVELPTPELFRVVLRIPFAVGRQQG